MTTRAEFDELRRWRAEPLEYKEELDARDNRAREAYLAATHSLATIDIEHIGWVLKDPVHGWVPLDDPFINDIRKVPAFERLWEVQQFGDRWAVASMLRSAPHSRAEHALGTHELIRRFGPDDPALRAAAVLHDTGHTAFSHHGEAVFDRAGQQEWHESRLEQLLTEDRFGIRSVLTTHGISEIEVLANFEHPLLDRPKPDLCADRIDYVLRDGVAASYIHERTAHDIVDELAVTPEYQWYCRTPWSADTMERLLILLDSGQYSNPMMRAIKYRTRDLLTLALGREYLTVDDISEGTDDEIMEKLWAIQDIDPEFDNQLLEFVELGLPRDSIETMGHAMDNYDTLFDGFDLPQKRRHIDPLCAYEAKTGDPDDLRPLSEWRRLGYDPRFDKDAPAVINLLGLPHMTPDEADAFGVRERHGDTMLAPHPFHKENRSN